MGPVKRIRMPPRTNGRDPQRAIVEYLIGTGFLTDAAKGVAATMLAGQPLSDSQLLIFHKQIADVWFRLDCMKCRGAIRVEDIPDAIEIGHFRCSRCRPLSRTVFRSANICDAQFQKICVAATESWHRRRSLRRLRPS